MSESDKAQPSPKIKVRIEALSDLVFGLALSIGSLELLAKAPQTSTDLETSIALFAFSFLIVVSIWLSYARIVAVMSQETTGFIGLNLLLLFLVVLEPYLFFVLQNSQNDDFLNAASLGYALDVGGMFLILSSLVWLMLHGKKPSVEGRELHPLLIRRFRVGMIFNGVIGAIWVFSALVPADFQTPLGRLRFLLWYSSFAFLLFGIVNRRRAKEDNQKHRERAKC